MTPFFLNGKGPKAMQRELFTNGYHDCEYYQRDTSILPTSTGLGRRARIVQPSSLGYRKDPFSYEPRPPWFTSRSSRYPYGPSLASTSMSAAEIAHRSLAHDLYNPHSRAYACELERYSDCYTTYYPSRQPEYPIVQKNKKAGSIHMQRRGDELLFVRRKGNRDENGGWRKTEKEVEWLQGRRWM
ncbi:hypothetical protein G6011_07643 [Alternaria panax]|uniref:Uncharacterized protein n=1 Tax=Alternaria panax TaxID=48097 RepID=A0AAD4I736_9PLEO|nr:hypothetical protein G6011_07643 [Alternaria panax]